LVYDPSSRYQNLDLAVGKKVKRLERRGKYLIGTLAGDRLEVIIHLGMTGGFRFVGSSHTRVTVTTETSTLYFQDSRRFGKWIVVAAGDYSSMPTLHHMGPEPLSSDFDLADFVVAASSCGTVKPWLLSQKPVAGLGNIYVDEALFLAKIHPQSVRLSQEQATRLHAAIIQVLARAVEVGGSTLSDKTYQQPDGQTGYFQLEHRVYAREGQGCPLCGTPLEKIWLAGRGTHFCSSCQVLGA
jgi:formamidopyrimidine-DNA glycosylase